MELRAICKQSLIAVRWAWLAVAILSPAAVARGEILGLYQAGNNAVAWSPSFHWGWTPSWTEQFPGDPYGYSVTGSAGGGVTAWQILDPTAGGVNPNYSFQLCDTCGPNSNLASAQQNGWSFSSTAQLVSDMQSGPNQGISAYFNDRLFQLMIDLDLSGNLQALVPTSNAGIVTLPLKPADVANSYYDYELRFDAATQLSSFYFEGQNLYTWAGTPATHPTVFRFGSVTTSGAGQMNFREVEMSILELSPSPTEQGDYNGDGVVNLADYSVWRDSLGSESDLVADGSGNRLIDAADYEVWKDNFGARIATIAASQGPNSVPEPAACLATLVVVSTFIVAMIAARRTVAT